MKTASIIPILLLTLAGGALAGSEYDRCINEEKTLKAREAEECSGLRQLLNPSACYATQRILKEYRSGRCRQIALAEHIEFAAPAVISDKKSSAPLRHGKTVDTMKKAEEVEAGQELNIKQLREENERLKAENEQLRKALRQ